MLNVAAKAIRMFHGHATFRKCVLLMLCGSGIYLLFTTALHNTLRFRQVYQQHQEDILLPTSRQQLQVVSSVSTKGVEFGHHGDERGSPHSVSVSPRVLVLYDKISMAVAKQIQAILQSHRVPHDMHTYDNPSFDLTTSDPSTEVGKYCLVVCAGMYSQLQRYQDYARRFNVTIISFASADASTSKLHAMGVVKVKDVAVSDITGVKLNPSREFYYLKTGEWLTDVRDANRWATFVPADSADYPADGHFEVWAIIKYYSEEAVNVTTPLVLVTGGGRVSEVTEVLVGIPVSFWLSKMLLLEAIRTYSSVKVLRFGRERWVMIDIDDIFVAGEGLKMSPDDVQVRFFSVVKN